MVLGIRPPSQTHLPSLSFFPTSTVYSANGLVGLFRPTTSHGVRAVSTTTSLLPHFCDIRSSVAFPGPYIIPFKAFPFATAVLCHHSRCLLAVVCSRCFQLMLTRPQGFTPLQSPSPHNDVAIVLWPDTLLGFVPLQGSPLNSECLPKVSGVIPPKRHHSEQPPPKRWRSGLAHIEMQAGHERFMPIPAVVQLSLPPATTLAPKRRVLPACRPYGQPALEIFERPLIHFSRPHNRLRWSPAMLLLVLQRPFQVEVALISRVFRAPDRSPLTDCISSSATVKTGSTNVEVTICLRHRRLLYASTHRNVLSVSSVR